MKYFYWLFILAIAAVVAIFCVSNRDLVSLAFWPLPYTLTIPLYLSLIGPLILGLIIGRLMGYIGGADTRRERNRLRVKTRELERDVAVKRPLSEGAGTLVMRKSA